MPLGPWNLCGERVRRSAGGPSLPHRDLADPLDGVAVVDRAGGRQRAWISAAGWMDAGLVVGPLDADERAAGGRRGRGRGRRGRRPPPGRMLSQRTWTRPVCSRSSARSRTAACSSRLVMRVSRSEAPRTPRMARSIDSVPPGEGELAGGDARESGEVGPGELEGVAGGLAVAVDGGGVVPVMLEGARAASATSGGLGGGVVVEVGHGGWYGRRVARAVRKASRTAGRRRGPPSASSRWIWRGTGSSAGDRSGVGLGRVLGLLADEDAGEDVGEVHALVVEVSCPLTPRAVRAP
jgi:hypothetical protein